MNTSASPETVHELFNRAFELHQGNQRDAAKGLYEEVLAREPRHAHAIHSLGVIASADGRRSEAIQLFQQAIAIHGKEAIFFHNLGRTLQADGRSTEGVHALRKAVEINPEFLGAWQALAELHYSLDNSNEAARAIQKVADLQTKTSESHNQKGLALVKENRLKEAVEEFRAGMACNPRGAGLYFNAGNVLSALGQHADAVSCLTQAASLEPKTPRIYVFLSNAHYRKGDLDAALRARAKAWQLDSTLPDEQFEVSASPIVAHPKRPVAMGGTPTRTTTLSLTQAIQQAVERHNAGDGASAEMLYRKVLEVDPVNADALHLLGVVLHQRGDHRGALELIDRVVVRGNASANVHANRAAVLIAVGEFDAAGVSASRAIEIDRTLGAAHRHLGFILRQQNERAAGFAVDRPTVPIKDGPAEENHYASISTLADLNRDGEVLAQSTKTAEQDQNAANKEFDSAILLTNLERYAEAIPCYRRAIELAGNSQHLAGYWRGLGVALGFDGRVTEALSACDVALSIDPGCVVTHVNRAILLLKGGNFRAGWEEYEWRRKLPVWEAFDMPTVPPWRGEDLQGKTIVLLAEQGLGDTIQFIRYAPLLARRGGRVIVVCKPELRRLFTLVGGVEGVCNGSDAEIVADFQCHFLSLPLCFSTTIETIPNQIPYIKTDSISVAKWSQRLAQRDGDMRVGLVWTGQRRVDSNLDRAALRGSFPLSTFAPLFDLRGVRFFSLQKDAPVFPPVIGYPVGVEDFFDLVPIVRNLDLVISVDTSIAHLAGAMGKPVWLLSRYDACWRWLLDRSDSPWYPTMRVFRQPRPGDWGSVISQVKTALTHRVPSDAQHSPL